MASAAPLPATLAGVRSVSEQERRAAIDLPRLGGLTAQLALLLLVLWGYNVLDERFLRLSACCFAGFLLHYFAPFAWKKQTFVVVSLVGGFFVLWAPDEQLTTSFQATFAAGATVAIAAAVGLAFYVSLRLPLPFWIRLSAVAAIVLGLAYARIWRNIADPLWYVLGGLFMFRMIIYTYDVRVSKEPEKLSDFMSYFFLLPNFYFALFPVIDYTTFKRSWYADDIHRVAQRGISWIIRGAIHLLLYNLIYQTVLISPDEVQSFPTMLRFIFPAFWLYLYVSGTFHIIVGMLHLFGYALPETNHYYFFSSSFTDFWRRINIYWKDFMVKCFYYPVYFRLRKRPTLALVVATITVFVATTLLHSYQMFWLHGHAQLTLEDALFWGTLGVLVLLTVLYEAKRRRKRAGSKAWSFTKRALSTLGVYITISVLWSMWSSQSIESWLDTVMYWR